MKTKIFTLSSIACFLSLQAISQNIGINTDGSVPESNVLLDVKGTNPLTTTGTQTVFQLKSFDANGLKLRMILGTDATVANTYGALEVYDATNSAYRALSLQPTNGNVGIGTTAPGNKLDVIGNTYISGNTALYSSTVNSDIILNASRNYASASTAYGFNFNLTNSSAQTTFGGKITATLSAAGNLSVLGLSASGTSSADIISVEGGDFTATSNSLITGAGDHINGVAAKAMNSAVNQASMSGLIANCYVTGTGTTVTGNGIRTSIFANGTSTYTNAYGLNISGWSKAAGATVGTSAGIYMDNSIDVGTTKYALYSSSASNSYFAGNVGIGISTPLEILHVQGTNPAIKLEDASAAGNVLLMKSDNVLGPLLVAHTNSAGNSTINGPAHQIELGTTALIFRESPTTAVGNARTFTEQMRLDNSGNLGVGTTNPTARLHVSYLSPSAGMYAAKIQNTGTAASAPGAALIVSNGYPAAQGGENYEVFGVYGNNFGSSYLTVSDDGHVGIGTLNPGSPYLLAVNGQPGANGYTAFTNYSDSRLKKNIESIGSSLDKIMKLRPVQFNYNEEYLNLYNDTSALSKLHRGFIAQEVKEIFPEMVGSVKVKDKEYYDLNLSNLQVYMVKAMQEQQKMIDEQKETISSLKKENHQSKDLISEMEKRISAIESTLSQTTMK